MNLRTSKDTFLYLSFTTLEIFHRGTWKLLVFCPWPWQSSSSGSAWCVRVVTKSSLIQQVLDAQHFSSQAPMTVGVANLSWYSGNLLHNCLMCRENNGTLCIQSADEAREQQPSHCHKAATDVGHSLCTSKVVSCCHMFPSYGLHDQLELMAKHCHYAAKHI